MQKTFSSPTVPAAVPAAVARMDGAHGYLTSSFELRAGLEISAVAMAHLPAELLQEFQRLRSSWEPGPRPL